MDLSQKCQYALRGLYELAWRYGGEPARISEISQAQAIPPRFLEIILGELKQAGYVQSRRGAKGGYMLSVRPDELTVGRVIRFVDGPLSPVKCIGGQGAEDCPLEGQCAFMGLWKKAISAVTDVYDTTTFQDLIDEQKTSEKILDFSI
jgi:Rrf2 family protein